MNTLEKLINELEEYSAVHHKTNDSISKSSVGWHIDHALKVINQIIDSLEKSNPANYKWRFSAIRYYILATKIIPRGKGKAPKSVVPEGEITLLSLTSAIKKTRLEKEKLNNLNPNNYFKHPYFGDLNLRPTKVFLNIHTNHHLKIIKDIIKAS